MHFLRGSKIPDTNIHQDRNANEVDEDPSARSSAPTIALDKVRFSDESIIDVDREDVIVLVGPNNAGKSLALRELKQHLGGNSGETKVVKSVEVDQQGTREEFIAFLRQNIKVRKTDHVTKYEGYGIDIHHGGELIDDWPRNIWHFISLFCTHVTTENRISDSNPIKSIAVLDEPQQHPIHLLFMEENIEKKISKYFQQAFGEDLVVFHGGGSISSLLVGTDPGLELGENRTSQSYCKRLTESCSPLVDQGDGMRSFASVLLHVLAPVTPTILLLDEPEAFLHPTQARLLGRLIATEKPSNVQLFVATHSPDFLRGVMDAGADHIRLLRVKRQGNVNYIKELENKYVKKMITDPLLNYSLAIHGVFHERVIICEGDSDCMFYRSLLHLPEVNGGNYPDVLFIHGNGKHRVAELAGLLGNLDVPLDIVVDIDVLDDLRFFQRLVLSIHGDWEQVAPLASQVHKSISNQVPLLDLDKVKERICEECDTISASDESIGKLASRIRRVFDQSTPWRAIKRAGCSMLPPGQVTQQFNHLLELCSEAHLWIVEVGETEGYCRSIGKKGPAWVQEVLDTKRVGCDPELENARTFVRGIWESRRHT